MDICIVEITKVKSKSWLHARELYPTPSNEDVIAHMASAIPMSQDAGGLYSVPEVSSGIKAIAIRYQYEFLIIGFFSDFVPKLADRGTNTLEESLNEGDINIRSGGGNRVTLTKSGKIELFSNIFTRFSLSQAKEMITGYFKRIRIKWFGGHIEAIDEETTNIALTKGFQPSATDDSTLDTEELPPIGPQSASLNASSYVDKAIITNKNSTLQIETRQNTGGTAAPMGFMKDVFTVENRGHRGDDLNTVYDFQTIDKSRSTTSSQTVTHSGLALQSEKLLPTGALGDPVWSSSMLLGEELNLRYKTSDVDCSLEFLESDDYNLRLSCNDHFLEIGDTFKIYRQSESGAFEFFFDEDGSATVSNSQFNITSDVENGKLSINLTKDTNMQITINDAEVDFGTDTQGSDNVLTPNSIFGDSSLNYDTFTGLPFMGSKILSVKDKQ